MEYTNHNPGKKEKNHIIPSSDSTVIRGLGDIRINAKVLGSIPGVRKIMN